MRSGLLSQPEPSSDTNPSAKRANASALPSQAPAKLDFSRRLENRQLTTEQLLQLLQKEAPQLWEMAQVVGNWVWITFPQRPPRQTTTTLSQFGFNWNKIRQAWQHPCGDAGSKRANYAPRKRYGSRPALALSGTKGGQENE